MHILNALSDDELRRLHELAMRRHDNLIDNADMGDERIYVAQKEIDAYASELQRRGLRW